MTSSKTQNPPFKAVRSPGLVAAERSVLVVVDVQEKLLGSILGGEQIVQRIDTMLAATKLMNVPLFGTEQYPERLGATVEPLQSKLGNIASKRMFSFRECFADLQAFWEGGRRTIVLCGIESHVCILQSAFDLLAGGWDVVVVIDAIGSRKMLDHQCALERMKQAGVKLLTSEMVMFEWCETSTHPNFKAISQLVKGS